MKMFHCWHPLSGQFKSHQRHEKNKGGWERSEHRRTEGVTFRQRHYFFCWTRKRCCQSMEHVFFCWFFFPLVQSALLSHQCDLHLLPPLDLPTRMLLGRRRSSSDLEGFVDNSITTQDKQQNLTESFITFSVQKCVLLRGCIKTG